MNENGLERATAAIGELSGSVRALQNEVVQSEHLRSAKIRWIQRVLYVLVPAVLLMLLLAALSFVQLSRINRAAADARSTSELLSSCFMPDTRCSQESAKKTAAAMDQLRQTQFVIAVCQRKNPLPTNPTSDEVEAGTERLQACVRTYYPGFTLPPKATPTPTTTSTPTP